MASTRCTSLSILVLLASGTLFTKDAYYYFVAWRCEESSKLKTTMLARYEGNQVPTTPVKADC